MAIVILLFFLSAGSSFADGGSPAEHARAQLASARANYDKAKTNPEAAWRLGRAIFDLADVLDDSNESKKLAQEGVAICQQAVSLAPDQAPGHYYLALNLGELARSKKLGALKLLHVMEDELTKALEADPKFDYSGPDRTLGMLYLEAPSFPISIGSRNKARAHLQAAVNRNPEYLENRICLAEADARWGDVKQLQSELNRIHAEIPSAKARFSGERWAADWRDWNNRIKKLEARQGSLAANPPGHVGERGVPRR